MRRTLIIGATSAIGEATARIFAARGDALFLVGRKALQLQAVADDLKVRGAASVETFVLDVREFERYAALIEAADANLGGIDAALIAHGTLPDQRACQQSIDQLRAQFDVNAVAVMGLCTVLSNYFEQKGRGVLAVISSVAGDRGRQSNYAYGAAKAAVTAFTSGLRQRLYRTGVRVVTIKPGPVDTPMTASFRKGALWALPPTVAAGIARAMDRGSPVAYTPWFWRPAMLLIRAIPERLFRRVQL